MTPTCFPAKFILPLCLLLSAASTSATIRQSNVPQLTAIEPKTGATTPGIKATVYGTGFSSDAVVYIGGLQVRDLRFISPTTLEVITPYLRPGEYKLQLKSGGIPVRSQVTFTASSSQIDSEIDHAISLAREGRTDAAIAILSGIAKTNADYQVRSFAHYQIGQIYLAAGDLLKWGWTLTFLDADKSGTAVQTSWRYGLDNVQSTYFLNSGSSPEYDLRNADIVVANDVTDNPEPRFFRGLINARYGHLTNAKADSDVILKVEPNNSSYRALAAYIAVLSGNKTQLQAFSEQAITDVRALSLLGEAAYLSGDTSDAQSWWSQEATVYPLGAKLAYWAGKKHLADGQRRVAESLLEECVAMAPSSKEAKEARELLTGARNPAS